MIKKKSIVVVGGGNGSAITLQSCKPMSDEFLLQAVICMSDSGGSSGILREELNALPPGDILRAILALSPIDYEVLKAVFYKERFENTGRLTGHNIGNIFLSLAAQYSGNFIDAIRSLEQAVQAKGIVHPVTLQNTRLIAQLMNGNVVKGESSIDHPLYDASQKIKKVWLNPSAQVCESARQALLDADIILLGPGSLYTSIIATLLPEGMFSAIEKSKAKLIYIVGNAYGVKNETGPQNLSGFIEKLEEYLPRKLDIVLYNNHELSNGEQDYYRNRGWAEIKMDETAKADKRILQYDYEKLGGGLDPEKINKILTKLLHV